MDAPAGAINTDSDYARICESLKRHRSWLTAGSLTNHAVALGVSRYKLLSCGEQHACMMWLKFIYDFRASLRSLIRIVTDSVGILQTMYCFSRYDETPMKAFVLDVSCVLDNLPPEQKARVTALFEAGDLMGILADQVSSTQGLAKLLQCEFVVCALCYVQNRWRVFSWQVPQLILAMSSTNAQCYYTCLKLLFGLLGLGEFLPFFARYQRVSLTDGAAPCEAFERGASRETKSFFPELASSCMRPGPCTTHSKHNKKEYAFKPYLSLHKHVSDVVRVLQGGTALKTFKDAWQCVMCSVPIVPKVASIAQLQLNERALDLVLPVESETAAQKTLLLRAFQAPYGSGELEVYETPGETEQDTRKRLLSRDLALAVVGVGPGSFPSRSWSHSEDAPRWIARLMLLNVFNAIWVEFERLMKFTPKVRVLPGYAEGFLPIDLGGDALEPGDDSEPEADAATQARCDSTATDAKSQQIETERKEQNRSMRRIYHWRTSGFMFVDIWTFSIAHNPWVHLQRHDFAVASEKFDREQSLRELRNSSGIEPVSTGGRARQAREYRCVIAFEGKGEQRFLDHIKQLMVDPSFWDVVPAAQRTARVRTRATLLLIASGCLIHKMKDVLQRYPNKLIATVRHPELLSEVKLDAACPARMDAASYDFIKFYDDLASPEAKADIEVLARFTKLENIKIEYRNQRIPRFVVGRSLQRRVVGLRSLNVFWKLRNAQRACGGQLELLRRHCIQRRPMLLEMML